MPLVDRHRVDHEHERLVRRNVGRIALGAVAELRRDHELAPSAFLDADEALVPAGDDLTRTELEREWRARVPRRVELAPVREVHPHVVHDQGVALLGTGSGALDDVLLNELPWRGAG